ncbi:Transcriptional regulator [Sporomusa sp. KB1]|jgi:predicted transcriptional regulator|nr:Transcriptional regulator [Sporomusa sp. KB1]
MYFPGIEAFLAIVRTESISKAAELLHLSQATVSYRLKRKGLGDRCTVPEVSNNIL